MPAVGGFVFDSSGAPADREIRVYRRDTGDLLGKTRSSGGDVGDPHFDKVMLLLHMDGADGSTVFTDSSPTPKTVTANGNAQISTAQSKFGGGSAHFVGSGGYLTTTNTASLEFGTGDFTVEGWIFCESVAGNRAFLCLGSYFQKESGIIFYISNGKIAAYNGSHQFIATNASVSANVWAHVAWVRSGTSFMMFTDGVLHHQGTLSANLSPTSTPIAIGFDSQFSNAEFVGYIDDLRITKGVARYTANFTPPAARFNDFYGPGRTLAFGEYYFEAPHTGEVNVVCLDDASAPLENDLILRTFPV